MTEPGRGRLLGDQTAILASAALTLALGLIFLGSESVWLDEAFSVAAARLPWDELIPLIADSQANMSLYYALLHVWLPLGEGEFTVRALSVLCAAAAPPTLYLLVRRLFDARTALIAAALLALNAYFLRYAQEARGYALLVLLVTLSTYLLVVAVEGRTRTAAVGYAVVAALATYVHVFAGFVVIGHAIALVLARRDLPRRWLLGVFGLWGLLVAPLAVVLLRQDSGQIDWITTPGPTDVVAALAKLAGGPFSAVAYLVLCGAALLGIRRSLARYGRWPLLLVAAWLATPLVLSLAASAVKPIFLAVYLIVSLPALATLASLGLASLRGPAALAVATVALGLVAVDLARGYDSEHESWRAATSHVLAASQPGDRIAFYAPYTRIPFEYYRRRAEGAAASPTPVYPPERWGRLALEADNLAGTPHAAAAAADGAGRVWLVVSHADDAELAELTRSLGPRGRLLSVRSFKGVDVRLYRLRRS